MLVCDICGKEIKISRDCSGFNPKQRIYYMYACRAWQDKEIDICPDCLADRREALQQAEADWYQAKTGKIGG